MQVSQSVAQKLTTYTLPLSWLVEIFCPDSNVKVASGTCLDVPNANQASAATASAAASSARRAGAKRRGLACGEFILTSWLVGQPLHFSANRRSALLSLRSPT